MASPDRPAAPYKFLDFYREADRDIFFGRRRETEVLLADIVAARFVVLFARTGTGKSSLIHAGVVPRLHDLDYETVLTRVGSDPTRAVAEKLGLTEYEPLKLLLVARVNRTNRPLVVFFDQFEEFFLGDVPPETQRLFLTEVGGLYRDTASGVHLVFSLREDYLARMAAFRAEIPTIFQTESQLWLRPLTWDQAKEAVEGPQQLFGFHFERGLSDVIVEDLPKEEGLISTVDVQVVCDTLWRKRKDETITRELYESLGHARGILENRIVNDVMRLDTVALLIIEQIIPELSTPDWTKRPRSLADLQRRAATDRDSLRRVIDALARLHLLNVDERGKETYVEWVSDHASRLSSTLTPLLQRTWLRKQLGAIDPERLLVLLSNPALTQSLTADDWYWLLRSATTRDTLGSWYANATRVGADAFRLLERFLADPALTEDAAQRVMLFLGEFTKGKPIDLLIRQLSAPQRARTALRALGALGNEVAIDVIANAARDSELQAAAIDALRVIGTDRAIAVADDLARRGTSIFDRVLGGLRRGSKTDIHGMPEFLWRELLLALRRWPESCAVVLGPDLPSRATVLAADLAKRFDYPFRDARDLRSVSNYLDISFGEGWRKEMWSRKLRSSEATRFYQRVPRIPVATYITTSLTSDLEDAMGPDRVLVHKPIAMATVATPVVLHVFGAIDNPTTFEPSHRRIEWSVVRPRTVIALGFGLNDAWLEYIQHLMTGSTTEAQDATWTVVAKPPALVGDPRSASRALDFFHKKSRGRTVYLGTPIEFLDEFEDRFLLT